MTDEYLWHVRLPESDTGWLELPDQTMEQSKIWEDPDVEITIVWW